MLLSQTVLDLTTDEDVVKSTVKSSSKSIVLLWKTLVSNHNLTTQVLARTLEIHYCKHIDLIGIRVIIYDN